MVVKLWHGSTHLNPLDSHYHQRASDAPPAPSQPLRASLSFAALMTRLELAHTLCPRSARILASRSRRHTEFSFDELRRGVARILTLHSDCAARFPVFHCGWVEEEEEEEAKRRKTLHMLRNTKRNGRVKMENSGSLSWFAVAT